jgi:hypothetical protein
LWAISNNAEPEIRRNERKKILSMFTTRRDPNEKRSERILFLKSIFGVAKLRINKR